jgi:hypothetical protein
MTLHFGWRLRGLHRKPKSFERTAVPPLLDPGDEKACEVAFGAFNLFFEAADVRIFTASLLDLSHRWDPLLGEKDVVIFSDPWILRDWVAPKTEEFSRFPDNLYFLCNDWQTYYARKGRVRNIALVNQNCFMDESVFGLNPSVRKRYDVLYNARRSQTKRHHLAREIGEHMKLALIYPHHDKSWYDVSENELPKHTYHNKRNLSPPEITEVINQSKVGLILSAEEGACFASSEYLLCGVPVISTPSKGGRSFWYNDENSLIVDADPMAILIAAKSLIAAERDPQRIRAAHLALMKSQRQVFLDEVLRPIKERFELREWDYESYFENSRLIEEFGFRKDCWFDVASICARLRSGSSRIV